MTADRAGDPAADRAGDRVGTAGLASLLTLADQRLPAGGHAHSGGVEEAVRAGLVHDPATLRAFLARRLATTGRVCAGIAAAATGATSASVAGLDREVDARTPSLAQRAASRAQGRGLLRLARSAWVAPHAELAWADLGPRPHHAVVVGCAARAAGLGAAEAALVAAYLAVTGPTTAAQRLLGLDPVAVAVVTLDLGPSIEHTAKVPGDHARNAHDRLAPDTIQPLGDHARNAHHAPAWDEWPDLPDDADPLLDLLAERHAIRTDRLFAS